MQVPPFWHGWDWHSLISISQFCPVKPGIHCNDMQMTNYIIATTVMKQFAGIRELVNTRHLKSNDSHHTGSLPHIPCRWRHCGRVCFHNGPLGFHNSFQCSQQNIYNNGYFQYLHNDHHGDIVHLSGSLIRKIWKKSTLTTQLQPKPQITSSNFIHKYTIPLWRAAVSQETLWMSQ